MAQQQLQDERGYQAATKEARRSTAEKLLQQLVTKRQMAAVVDQEGKLCTWAERVGKGFRTFRESLMRPHRW